MPLISNNTIEYIESYGVSVDIYSEFFVEFLKRVWPLRCRPGRDNHGAGIIGFGHKGTFDPDLLINEQEAHEILIKELRSMRVFFNTAAAARFENMRELPKAKFWGGETLFRHYYHSEELDGIVLFLYDFGSEVVLQSNIWKKFKHLEGRISGEDLYGQAEEFCAENYMKYLLFVREWAAQFGKPHGDYKYPLRGLTGKLFEKVYPEWKLERDRESAVFRLPETYQISDAFVGSVKKIPLWALTPARFTNGKSWGDWRTGENHFTYNSEVTLYGGRWISLAEKLFRDDLAIAGRFLIENIPVRYRNGERRDPFWLNQGLFDALSCLCFELGENEFKNTDLFEKLRGTEALPSAEEIYSFAKREKAQFYLDALSNAYKYAGGFTEKLVSPFPSRTFG